jgi:hypothetical protein
MRRVATVERNGGIVRWERLRAATVTERDIKTCEAATKARVYGTCDS